MWRWTKRITIALMVLLAIGAGFLYWAHRQTKQIPDFYTEAIAKMPEQTVQASKQLTADVERLQSEAARAGSWRAKFSDEQINAWLLEELPKKFPQLLQKGVSDPRIVIRDGHMLVAAKYKNNRFDTVVSCQIAVELTEQANMLAIHITNVKAGALPVPFQQFISKISKEAAKGEVEIQWDMTDEGPVALVSVPSEHPKYVISPVIVESLQMNDGTLVVSGHTGQKAKATFQPRGQIHQFVSFAPIENAVDETGDENEAGPNRRPPQRIAKNIMTNSGQEPDTSQRSVQAETGPFSGPATAEPEPRRLRSTGRLR